MIRIGCPGMQDTAGYSQVPSTDDMGGLIGLLGPALVWANRCLHSIAMQFTRFANVRDSEEPFHSLFAYFLAPEEPHGLFQKDPEPVLHVEDLRIRFESDSVSRGPNSFAPLEVLHRIYVVFHWLDA